MVSKKILLPVVAIVAGGTFLFGASQIAQAQSNGSQNLAQVIAQKFNLDQGQVQSTIDQFRQQKMQRHMEDVLSQAVSQGKITDAQKQAILNELNQLKNKYTPESFQNLTPQQRMQRRQDEMNEFKNWAQSQGIDMSFITHFGHGFGMKMHHGFWLKGSPIPTTTPQS